MKKCNQIEIIITGDKIARLNNYLGIPDDYNRFINNFKK